MENTAGMQERALALEAVADLTLQWEARPRKIHIPPEIPPRPELYDKKDINAVCKYGDFPALQALMAQGMKLNTKDSLPLRYAANYGHTEMVGFLLDHGADIHAIRDCALHWASSSGHTDTVRLLLDRGAHIHADNDLALRWAKHNEMIELLVERGAPLGLLNGKSRRSYEVYQEEQAGIAAAQKALHLAAKQSLTEAFKAATWAGHAHEMAALWQQVPAALQADLDFQHALAAAKVQTIKRNKPKIIIKK
jgi:ankyrin repeat protein